MDNFIRTITGRKFFEGDLPKLIMHLGEIAKELKRSNDIQEKKFKLDEIHKKLQIKESKENKK